MFDCERCGCCCRQVGSTIWGKAMADEQGICRYLDQERNICEIYEQRPDICRVDLMYEQFYREKMSLEDFYKMNKQICRKLQGAQGSRYHK